MLDGAIQPKKIAKAAKDRGFPAIALTDRNGLYATMAFAPSAISEGVQPIIGTMLGIKRPEDCGGQGDGNAIGHGAKLPPDWIALYAQNEAGYANLCRLVSSAHLDRPLDEDPHVDMDFLAQNSEGLIALTAGGEGALARLLAEQQDDKALAYLERLKAIFPDRLYIELVRRGDPVEKSAEEGLINFAMDYDVPMVATNPACYSDPNFHKPHDAMKCIAANQYISDEARPQNSPELWIKTARMMRELFSDIPEALENTCVIAKRCGVAPPMRKPILPSLAGDLEGEIAQLKADAKAGLDDRLAGYDELSADERKKYDERLEYELGIIVNMGFPGYFLIVADFIKWAKAQGIPVGPGRGSGAGSLVAWALTITNLDPLEHGLLFERFLNPERVSMPDFDIDFCETRRGLVIRYVQEKYGRDHVAQIITFGTMKARAVLRDVGRVLQMGYNRVDKLCKLVPNHPTDPWTLDMAKSGVDELRRQIDEDDEVRTLFELAMRLEGLPRHSSTHAAGVVIGDRPLSELVPLYRDPRSDMPVTQFDMKFVEAAGLVKFDFLGLKTLSVIAKALEMIAKRGITIDMDSLPMDDEGVFELLKRGDTVGVFQLESVGMRRTLAQVKPTNFGDIIALVSLYRPGPMDNIPSFGARKNGKEEIIYPHPLLEGILSETYGIIVYQEQVMQAAQILAGYTLGEADLLRRAMGKKIQAEMDKQRKRFVEGAAKNDIDAVKANELFDLIDKFAGYGFNKSHAAAYALLSYQTAWLKAHYPEEFFAASMCFDMHQSEKLNVFVQDMQRLNIACLPPCINHSEAEYAVEKHGDGYAVRYALAGLKNVGEKAMEELVNGRAEKGAFTSLADMAQRIDPSLLNKRTIENLAKGGAFDGLNVPRKQVHDGADILLSTAQSAHKNRVSGQGGLFSMGDDAPAPALHMPETEDWSGIDRLNQERSAFGFYFSAHPVSEYRSAAMAEGALPWGDIVEGLDISVGERSSATTAILMESAFKRKSKRGKIFASLTVSDESGQHDAMCFDPDLAEQCVVWAAENRCILAEVEFDRRSEDQAPGGNLRSAVPLDELAHNVSYSIEMTVETLDALDELAPLLNSGGKGASRVKAHLTVGENDFITMILGRNFSMDDDRLAAIEDIKGIKSVKTRRKAKRIAKVDERHNGQFAPA